MWEFLVFCSLSIIHNQKPKKTNKNQSFSTRQDKSDIINNRVYQKKKINNPEKKNQIYSQKNKIKIEITSTHSSIWSFWCGNEVLLVMLLEFSKSSITNTRRKFWSLKRKGKKRKFCEYEEKKKISGIFLFG